MESNQIIWEDKLQNKQCCSVSACFCFSSAKQLWGTTEHFMATLAIDQCFLWFSCQNEGADKGECAPACQCYKHWDAFRHALHVSGACLMLFLLHSLSDTLKHLGNHVPLQVIHFEGFLFCFAFLIHHLLSNEETPVAVHGRREHAWVQRKFSPPNVKRSISGRDRGTGRMKLQGHNVLIMKMKPDTTQMRILGGWLDTVPLQNWHSVSVGTRQRQRQRAEEAARSYPSGQQVAVEGGEGSEGGKAAVWLNSGEPTSRREVGFIPPGLSSTSSCACLPLLSIKALATYVIPEQCWKCCIIEPQSVFLCFLLPLSELLLHSQKPFPGAFLCFLCCVPACQRSLRHAAHRRPCMSSYTLTNLQRCTALS